MNAWRSLRDLPHSLFLVSVAAFINRAGTMALPFMVLYLTRHDGLAPERAGFIVSCYGLGGLVAAPLAGKLSDRYGAKTITLLTLGFSGAAWLFFPLVSGPSNLAIACFALALIAEGFRPACMTLVGELAPKDKKKQAFAVYRLAINLGMSVGPPMGGLLATYWFNGIFILDGISSLIATALMAIMLRGYQSNAAPASKREITGAPAVHKTAWRDPNLMLVLAGVLLTGITFFQLESTLPLYMVEHLGLTEKIFGFMFLINTLLIVTLEVPLTAAIEHWSNRNAMALGAVLVGVGFGATGHATGLFSLGLTIAIWTFGEMLLFPSLSAHITDIAPKGRVGSYMGYSTMTFGCGFAVGPWLGTTVYQELSPGFLWWSCLALGLLGGLLILLAPDKPPQTNEPAPTPNRKGDHEHEKNSEAHEHGDEEEVAVPPSSRPGYV